MTVSPAYGNARPAEKLLGKWEIQTEGSEGPARPVPRKSATNRVYLNDLTAEASSSFTSKTV
jgi:hypothetical protein